MIPRTIFVALMAALLTGCATLQRPETLTACAAADVLTTTYAVHAGIAREVNPILAPSVNAHHFLPMALSKLTYIGLIWWLYEQYKDSKAAAAGMGVATVVTCGVSANNALIIVKGIR